MTMPIMNAVTVIRRRMTLGPLLLASLLLASCGGGGGSSGTPPAVTTPPSDLQYPAAPPFVVDTAITALTPTVVGEVTSYSVSPALPEGLSLNTTTGVITGTPTSVVAKADYTVKATNAGGSTTASVSFVVMTAATTAPSDLSYPTPPTFVVSTAIAPVKPTVVGEVTSYSVSPALPAGLILNTTTGVISGTPTTVTAKADYTVEATNAVGSTTATVSIVVTMTAAPSYTAKSGVAQKGPLIQGSTVTVQELDASLSPTGQQFSYQILTNFGTFSPTSTFTSQYLGLNATGYYFDEVVNAISTGPVTLNAYSDLAVDSVLNVNLLTTLEYQRIQNLVTQSNMTFVAARAQAETEVLAALNIPAANYGSFDSLNLSGNSDGDYILAAISSLFVYGNSAGPLSALIANFQSDIGKNGVITNPATNAALVAAAEGINPNTVAANLTQYYASQGLTFTGANISNWIAQSGDGVIGEYAFLVPDATPSTVFTFPSYVVNQFAGAPVSVTVGQLSVNGSAVSGTVTFNTGDVVTVSPSVGNFPNGVLTCYLVTGKKNLARVSFVSDLVSIAVAPNMPSVPLGVTQQFTATGTFSDTSTADLTSSVTWTSSTPAVATVNVSSGLANVLTAGSTVITATSGSVSGSTTLTVTPAALVSIAITPNPLTIGAGSSQQMTATGTYSDGSTQNVTAAANWTSSAPSVATIGPSTGLATGVSAGTATISATIGSITASAPLSVPALQSIVITPNPITIGAGSSLQLTATGTYSDGSTQDVTTAAQWTSDTPSVATIGSSTGLATGVSAGSATISATIGSVTGTAPLSVPALASIVITPTALTIGVGANLQFTATGIYADGSRQNLTTVANWASSMPSVATIGSSTGLATGVSVGSTTVSAISGSIVGTTLLAVTGGVYSGVWQSTGSMAAMRANHTATLLTNGSVLAAGGQYLVGGATWEMLGSAEIYNPTAGTWTATGSMTTARTNFTATLLPNGTVLVAGGMTTTYVNSVLGSQIVASAEIYDPVAGTWTPTANMAYARWNHTATLLPNGTVLVAGGGGAPFLASAEIYDPVAETWTSTGSMANPRGQHTATLLPNGTVLVASGQTNNTDLTTSAEIFDPGTGLWTVTGSLIAARALHTATLLPNGTVLVAGGANSTLDAILSSAEIYDPSAGTWRSAASMLAARFSHTATLLPSGKVLVAGGCNCAAPLSNAEVYDSVLGTWITTASMSTNRLDHTATLLLNGTVLAAGGTPNNGTVLSTAEIYQ
jgi:Big-like domain-containing protein/putative Ig domain-containing protein/galactose oxidase-like protein/Kelch motif protein